LSTKTQGSYSVVGKFVFSSFSFHNKIFISIQDVLIFWVPFKVHGFNFVHQIACILTVATSRSCISFIQCLFSIKIYWVRFPVKSSFYGRISISIQVILNVWELVEVQNLKKTRLQWSLAACFFFIWCPFPILKNWEFFAYWSSLCG